MDSQLGKHRSYFAQAWFVDYMVNMHCNSTSDAIVMSQLLSCHKQLILQKTSLPVALQLVR